MGDTFDLRRGVPSEADMDKINRVSKTPLTADQVYIFGMRLCDNEVDRDFERFTTQALEQLAKMYIGKTGIVHNMQEVGRIYETEIVSSSTKSTQAGDPYCWIKAYAYIVKNDDTKRLISSIKSGTQAEVSVGCSVAACSCSICGGDISVCEHVLGQRYNGQLCFANLSGALDAYEWAFVVKPDNKKTLSTSKGKLIDPVDVKQAVMSGQLEVRVCSGDILLGSEKSGEWAKIGQI